MSQKSRAEIKYLKFLSLTVLFTCDLRSLPLNAECKIYVFNKRHLTDQC